MSERVDLIERLRHQAIREGMDADTWDVLQLIEMRRRANGLKLAAKAIAMSQCRRRTAAMRANCLATAQRLIDMHGNPKPGWMQKRVAVEAERLEAEERALDDAGAPPYEDPADPTKWGARQLFALRGVMVSAGALVEVS